MFSKVSWVYFTNKLFAKGPRGESSRHAKRAFQKQGSFFSLSKTVMVLVFVFLFLPLIVVVAKSFNDNRGVEWTEFSLRWYRELLFNSETLWISVKNSLIVALVSSILATLLGTFAAIGVSWFRFRGKNLIHGMIFLPMVLPEVILGTSLLLFFTAINIEGGLFTITVAHVTFNLPFVFLMVMARLDEFDYSIVEASRDLGATEFQSMFRVILPSISPGIISGFLMAVTMSLEDYVITYLVSGKGSTTLPLYVFSTIRYGVSPVLNAFSFVLILATAFVVLALRKFLKMIAAAK